jgi:hypothetical protein
MECDSIREIQLNGTWNAIQLETMRWMEHAMLHENHEKVVSYIIVIVNPKA